MRLQKISLHLYLTTTLSRGISLTLVTLDVYSVMCFLLFIRILAALMAKILDGSQEACTWVALQVVFLKRFWYVCVYNALTRPAARSAHTSIRTVHISASLPKLKVTLTCNRWVHTIQALAAWSHI